MVIWLWFFYFRMCQQVCQHSVPTISGKKQFLLYEGFQKELNLSTVSVFFRIVPRTHPVSQEMCQQSANRCQELCQQSTRNVPTINQTVLTKCAKKCAKIVGTVLKKGYRWESKPLGKASKKTLYRFYLLR